MFQATEISVGHHKPAILHAYGGAKVGLERSLASIAAEGWIPMAAALLGTVDKPHMWASVGLRPVAGTTIDFRVLPPILSEREKLLMLSCWQQWDPTGVPSSALSRWLVGIDVEYGPDGRSSPTFLKQNFNVQEAADLYQAVHLHTLEDLAEHGPYPKVISQFALRIRQCQALGCTHVGSPACGSAPGCLTPPGYCIGNVWCLAHHTVPPQNASCVVDRLNDLDLESFDGR